VNPHPRPLAAAADRLRRPAGRPRKAPLAEQAVKAVSTTAAPVSGLRRLLTVRDAGQYLGLSVRTIHSLRAAGHLHPVQLPGLTKLLFDVKDLDRLVDINKAGQ
jgi:hypothetical protein